ncbi:MAG: c-type cytochrome [Acidobacteria bacterium]|nr:c-type cytochrome [Acidobacteriota bacterium]
MRLGKLSSISVLALLAIGALLASLAGCSTAPKQPKKAEVEEKVAWPAIAGYEEMKIPADNPMTRAKVELGKQLFYDKRLSGDGSRSCYSCHLKENGLTDGKPTAIGAYEAKLTRSSPTLWNIGYQSQFYWDGRSGSLEKQAVAAWGGGNMGATGKDGHPSTDEIGAKLNQIAGYKDQFQKVFGGPATPDNVGKAIAAFERTIVPDNSAWVRFNRGNGDVSAFSEEARRGWTIFSEKAKCTNCHDGLLLTDQQYHNVGIGMDAEKPDVGRFTVTKVDKDTGAFKTPTLLDISKSAPYFHNGSVATLEEATDLMLKGGKKNKYLDTTNLKPMKLTKAERADLLAFLRALDVDYTIAEPTLP